ncbi:mariner Mos1 transposase [Trichonephila clavipes]|nr:mariner Mos1 transposase [Trichonephila clavipes]
MTSARFTTSTEILTGTQSVQVKPIVAYDWQGVILTHAVLAGQTVEADYYYRLLKHHLRPRLLHNNFPIVLHGSVRCHVVNNVFLQLRRWQWEILKYFLYSLDMNHESL